MCEWCFVLCLNGRALTVFKHEPFTLWSNLTAHPHPNVSKPWYRFWTEYDMLCLTVKVFALHSNKWTFPALKLNVQLKNSIWSFKKLHLLLWLSFRDWMVRSIVNTESPQTHQDAHHSHDLTKKHRHNTSSWHSIKCPSNHVKKACAERSPVFHFWWKSKCLVQSSYWFMGEKMSCAAATSTFISSLTRLLFCSQLVTDA